MFECIGASKWQLLGCKHLIFNVKNKKLFSFTSNFRWLIPAPMSPAFKEMSLSMSYTPNLSDQCVIAVYQSLTRSRCVYHAPLFLHLSLFKTSKVLFFQWTDFIPIICIWVDHPKNVYYFLYEPNVSVITSTCVTPPLFNCFRESPVVKKSASALYRAKLKQQDPANYREYLNKQKLRSKLRRLELQVNLKVIEKQNLSIKFVINL